MKNKKAFTLIELIAVLVILAILALIVTPLVLNIIKKARTSADKRSIDAYGRSIELAIADYLLDTGKFPTSIDELTIEYSGNKVECKTTQLNEDSSVYLAECKVNNRDVIGYTYGKNKITYEKYSKGDYVLYNNIGYFVIEDSDSTNDTVKLLKETPLTYKETGMAESDDYGQVQFGESTDYSKSNVKQKVDVWASTAVKDGDSAIARLITLEELTDNLGYEYYESACGESYKATENVPEWVKLENYTYWTTSQVGDSSNIWGVGNDGYLKDTSLSNNNYIRPVLELNKSADINVSTYYKSYEIGDEVTYNNVDYYVIKKSNSNEENVTLLKSEPLTVEEVNRYGVGHVNMYTTEYQETAYDQNGYGGMAYYSSSNCTNWDNNKGCKNDYESSEIKYVVDAWKNAQASSATEARLITIDELTNKLGCTDNDCNNSVYSWLYNGNYSYWTSSKYSNDGIYYVDLTGNIYYTNIGFRTGVYCYFITVRPVIVLSKSVL